jgi:hypothetical protein
MDLRSSCASNDTMKHQSSEPVEMHRDFGMEGGPDYIRWSHQFGNQCSGGR